MTVPQGRSAFRAGERAAPWLPYLLLLVPLLLYLPGLSGFPYPNPESSFSDLAISHYPYGLYVQRALLAGRLPLWWPTILGGGPLFANPLSGLWYPPGWLALLLPLPLGFNLLVMAHLLWGGLGALRLLRAEGLDRPAALWGALAFECLPKLAAHYGAGHLTLVYAVAWTPWLLLAGRGGRFSARPGLVLALIFLADPRWCALAGLLWLGYRLAHRMGRPFLRVVFDLAAQAGLAGLLAAPLALPLLELTRQATRSRLSAQDFATYALPPGRLLGLFFPDRGGFHEYMLYSGQAVLLLALLAVLSGWWGRSGRFWAAAGGLALLWALAAPYPPLVYLAGLPGLNLLRVPSRAVFILGLALAALSAGAVQTLLDGRPAGRAARLILAALVMFCLVLSAGAAAASGTLPAPFAWGAGLAVLSLVWIGLRLGGRLPAGAWLAGLFVLGLFDWLAMDASLFTRKPAVQVLSEARPLAEFLAAQPQPARVYSPSYSLPQQTAAFYDLRLADGVDPLQLAVYVGYMQAATGVPSGGYSVTLPPYANGEPATDNAAYRPDPARLGALNVGYVAAEYDLDVPGLDRVQQFGRTRLYANRLVRPRAWMQADVAALADDYAPVEALDWQPERITIRAIGPGRLVLSEPIYPGWGVTVDGQPATIEPAAGLLRSVSLPPGEHSVVFVFRPASLRLGLGLAGLGFVLLGAVEWTRRRGAAGQARP